MPVTASSRQPGASTWFSGQAGQWLLAEERRWLAGALASRPVRPWLWVAPIAAGGWRPPSPRGLLLHQDGAGYAGSVRCGLPLPLPSECVGDVVLQHPAPERLDALLEESVRVLVEGGRLWLCVFTPWSPYRLRGGGAPGFAPSPGLCRRRLRALGLQYLAPAHFVGPCWRMRPGAGGAAAPLRAACVIMAEKRVAAPVAPLPLRWRRGAAPAA